MTDYREEKPLDFLLPENVKSWFTHLYTHLISGDVSEMAKSYDKEFSYLTNAYFKNSPWPEPTSIGKLVDHDPVFELLYTQIYYRHYFSKLQPTHEFKIASWNNYCKIFDGVLDGSLECDVLPSQWIFDIVGEFVYQYQSFSQYRAKIGGKSEAELNTFLENEDIWDTKTVLHYLNQLVKHSQIIGILNAQEHNLSITPENDKEVVEEPVASSEFVKELGYFALVCLSRAHVLYGDFMTSLTLLKPINLDNKNALFLKSLSCHISIYYHMGFAEFMLCKFKDAIQTLSSVVLQFHRNRNFYSRFADFEQLNKLAEKSILLLMMAISLSPGIKVDEQIFTLIKDKHNDKYQKMLKGNEDAFADVFSYACPRFILPSCIIDKENLSNRSQEPLQLQLSIFRETVQRHASIPDLRSYIKLYSSIEISKLALFLGRESEAVTRAELMAYKYNSSENPSDLHFFINNELVITEQVKQQNRSGQYYMKQIKKFAEIVESCEKEIDL